MNYKSLMKNCIEVTCLLCQPRENDHFHKSNTALSLALAEVLKNTRVSIEKLLVLVSSSIILFVVMYKQTSINSSLSAYIVEDLRLWTLMCLRRKQILKAILQDQMVQGGLFLQFNFHVSLNACFLIEAWNLVFWCILCRTPLVGIILDELAYNKDNIPRFFKVTPESCLSAFSHVKSYFIEVILLLIVLSDSMRTDVDLQWA